MRVEMEDWKNGWYGIHVGLSVSDIESLISLLEMIKNETDRHFHLSSKYEGDGGVGDIKIYVQDEYEADNMELMSKALAW